MCLDYEADRLVERAAFAFEALFPLTIGVSTTQEGPVVLQQRAHFDYAPCAHPNHTLTRGFSPRSRYALTIRMHSVAQPTNTTLARWGGLVKCLLKLAIGH